MHQVSNKRDLRNYIQGEREILKEYVARFNNEAMLVENLNDETTFLYMRKGTRIEAFHNSLLIHPVKTYAELLDRAYNFIRLDQEKC